MLAIPPADYGLTTSGELEVEARPGAQLSLAFGAANGYHAPLPDAGALAKLIDLSSYYNVALTESWHWGFGPSDLSELPRGLQTFAGVQFDVRGLIQIGYEAWTKVEAETGALVQ